MPDPEIITALAVILLLGAACVFVAAAPWIVRT